MELNDTVFKYRNIQASNDLIIPIILNSSVRHDIAFDNFDANISRDVEWLSETPVHEKEVIICGTGSSLNDCYAEIKQKQTIGTIVFSCNASAKLLRSNNIEVDYQIGLDPSEAMLDYFIDDAKNYLWASVVSPKLFEMSVNPVLWHPYLDWVIEKTEEIKKDFVYIGGGISVVMSALCIAYTMGYRKIHLYGADSSYVGNGYNATGGEVPESNLPVIVENNGKSYLTTYPMKEQVRVFLMIEKELKKQGCNIQVYGEGLLQDVFKQKA